MADLLCCPFCGSDAFVLSRENRHWAYCKNDECGAGTQGKTTHSDAVTAWNTCSTLSDAVAEREAKPVAFLVERLVGAGYGSPRSIVDAAKYDPRRDEFWCGDAKSRHLVTPLYALSTPPASELEALRKRVAELEQALDGLLSAETTPLHVGYDIGVGGGNYIYTDVIRVDCEEFVAARRVREGGKVDGL